MHGVTDTVSGYTDSARKNVRRARDTGEKYYSAGKQVYKSIGGRGLQLNPGGHLRGEMQRGRGIILNA